MHKMFLQAYFYFKMKINRIIIVNIKEKSINLAS